VADFMVITSSKTIVVSPLSAINHGFSIDDTLLALRVNAYLRVASSPAPSIIMTFT
jgi:hypothetical protein